MFVALGTRHIGSPSSARPAAASLHATLFTEHQAPNLALYKASRSPHSDVQRFHFRAPRRRSHTRNNNLVRIQVRPTHGPSRRWSALFLHKSNPTASSLGHATNFCTPRRTE